MPLNHYQQEVGPSLADASPGKMPDVALLEGRYCSVEHLTVAEHYKDILDFYFTLLIRFFLIGPICMRIHLNLKKLYVSVWRIMSNPRILISLLSGIRLQVRF